MPSASTIEKLNSPQVRQFSVFLQNKVGALLEVVKLLSEHNVVVLALSIQDSSESSIGRMVVSDPEKVIGSFASTIFPTANAMCWSSNSKRLEGTWLAFSPRS